MTMPGSDQQEGDDAVQPNIERARRAALVAHDVVIKLKESGLPVDLDADLGALSADLGDLWGAQQELAERLEGLTRSPGRWGSIGDYLVDLRTTIDHIGAHARSVRRPMTRITRFAYRTAEGE